MLKIETIKILFIYLLTPLFLTFINACTQRELEIKESLINIETVQKIEGVAALGQLIPLGEVRKLAAPTSGKGGTPRISKLLVKEGDYIFKDQLLAVFDNRSKLEADLAVAVAKSKIIINKIRIQEREINRYRPLLEQGAIASIVLEKMQDDLVILKNQKLQLLSSINAINYDLEQSQLRSPIDGIVLQILVREGERPSSNGVVNVGANHLMEALIEVYESDIDRVEIGQVVDLISENGGFKGTLKGQVTLISPQVRQRRVLSTDPTGDADSRVIEVTVKLDNVSAQMVSHLTGMKVIARFQP
tara:strand:- start:143 stop:1051 length:909 start_codon:yes stop_codon:yes gene_type:complete